MKDTNKLLPKDFQYFQSETDEPIHLWFELSYAQYLTIPRSVLQSMPLGWQKRFVKCLEELDELIDWRPKEGRYWVQLKDGKGRYVNDEFQDYERGRRVILLNSEQKAQECDATEADSSNADG